MAWKAVCRKAVTVACPLMRIVFAGGRSIRASTIRAAAWSLRHVCRWFGLLRWEYKVIAGVTAGGIVLICSAYGYAQFLAFLSPASAGAQQFARVSSLDGSYCTDWAFSHAQIGKPTASPCGVLMISVPISPSDAMPYTGNKYAFGNCTYWAAQRRAQIGKPIPNTWGDAYLWAGRARNDSYQVDHAPTAGAIMQTSRGALGHVAFVESVDGDGTWHISEMNVIGLNQVDYRAMPAISAAAYNFIH